MRVVDMALACKPMEYDTVIVARLPDGTIWTIDRVKLRMNRERDEAELILDLGQPVAAQTVGTGHE